MKKCLVVFPDDWIAYSPSTINMVAVLKMHGFEPTILTFKGRFSTQNISSHFHTIFIDSHSGSLRFLAKTKLLGILKPLVLYWYIRKLGKFDHYIGIDAVGCLALQLAGIRPFDYFSLEVKNSIAFRLLDSKNILRIVTQNAERLEIQFRKQMNNVFFVQNAPIVSATRPVKTLPVNGIKKLLYIGNAIASHGILDCVRALEEDDSLQLEIRGIIPDDIRELINASSAAKRITADDGYVEDADLLDYIRQFDVGLCLYNVKNKDPNYLTCPSGKMFNYMAAGIPMVGSRIPGLRIIDELGAGITVANNTPAEITAAIRKLQANYAAYASSSYNAFEKYEFSKMASPYMAGINCGQAE